MKGSGEPGGNADKTCQSRLDHRLLVRWHLPAVHRLVSARDCINHWFFSFLMLGPHLRNAF